MFTIKPVPVEQIDRFLEIGANAYPVMKANTEEEKKKFREQFDKRARDPRISQWGAYDGGTMVGGMRFFDFMLNIRGAKVLCGGGGFLAVDLTRKKEHVARDLVRFWLEHYRAKGAPVAILWPFRPDFYKKMGFGYGSKLDQYSVKPEALPSGGHKDRVRLLTRADLPALLGCYNRYVDRTTGMIEETQTSWEIMFDANPQRRHVGYEENGDLRGYAVFEFQQAQPPTFIHNNIRLSRLVYETPEALYALLSFFQSQADQIDRILIGTNDEYFHYLLRDVRNGTENLVEIYHESHVSGVGIMYRVINLPAIFEHSTEHSYGREDFVLEINLDDSFMSANPTKVTVHFSGGRSEVVKTPQPDARITLGVSEFSSLLVGAVPFRTLHAYGLAGISDSKHVAAVDRIFALDSKPVCHTMF
jgi:predicted acetyltransferase